MSLLRIGFLYTFLVIASTQNLPVEATDVVTNSHTKCAYWGDFAVLAHSDYTTRVELGEDDPEGGTKELMGYGATEEGSVGRQYYDEILALITSGAGSDDVYEAGLKSCLSKPEGSFDPSNF